MRCGYFDCFGGVAGDMVLGALVDAGLSFDVLRDVIARLRLPDVALDVTRVRRGALAATQVRVLVGPAARHGHRHLPDILDLIAAAELPAAAADRATRIFHRLAEAEARVHGIPVEKVHFHEVGAADAIVDIVGACVGLETLGLERITCSPLPPGSGSVRCEHGILPVPAPATLELLRGVPLATCDATGEMTTPTGAALMTTLAAEFGQLPPLRVDAIGYGAGTRDTPERPNVLRLLVGELAADEHAEADSVVVLEANMDDATGQAVAYAVGRLLEAGALDAYSVPITMKKGRPGLLVTVLARPGDVPALEALLFAETTTLGIRRHLCQRHCLAREHVTVTTPFGPIRVKIGRRAGQVARAWPEYEDCAAAARAAGQSLRAVQEAALAEWTQRHGGQPDRSPG